MIEIRDVFQEKVVFENSRLAHDGLLF